MNQANQLSYEQEFSLRRFADQVQNLSREQAQDLLIELNRQMMIRDNLYRQLLQPYFEMGPNQTPVSSFGSDSFAS